VRNQKLGIYPRLKCLACHLKRDPWIYARLNPWVPMFLAGEAFYAPLNSEFWDPPLPPMSEAEPKTGVLPPAKFPCPANLAETSGFTPP
jgi:hypothetical protein